MVAPQDILVTVLGNELLHRDGDQVSATGLIDVLDRFEVGTAAARAAIARLVRRDLLERHRDGRTATYSLTERAVSALTDGERRILGFAGAIDTTDTWTLLNYSLPKDRRAERDRLRRRLTFLGFGSPRDGSWIACGDRSADVGALLLDMGLDRHIDVFVGSPSPTTDLARLVGDAWTDLDSLGARYEAFAERWSAHTGDDPLADRVRVMHEWRQFPLVDPGLPDALLDWRHHRSAARQAFEQTWNELRRPAGAVFDGWCRATTTDPQPATAGRGAMQ